MLLEERPAKHGFHVAVTKPNGEKDGTGADALDIAGKSSLYRENRLRAVQSGNLTFRMRGNLIKLHLKCPGLATLANLNQKIQAPASGT